jgi:hypothetical protein
MTIIISYIFNLKKLDLSTEVQGACYRPEVQITDVKMIVKMETESLKIRN